MKNKWAHPDFRYQAFRTGDLLDTENASVLSALHLRQRDVICGASLRSR